MLSLMRYWLDKVYLTYFIIHLPILFCVDLVPLYPTSFWVPPSSPLHFLYELRVYYLDTYNDQFFAPPPADIPNFFPLFAFLELVFHLPISLWAVRTLLGGNRGASNGVRRSGLNGRAELLLLVYGIETTLTTATCMYEAFLWDPAIVTTQQKVVLLGGFYGGYLAVAILLTADMYARLLKRLSTVDDGKKNQ
ncbi:transmembrane protein 6/97 [Jackrogersella minutella]|nr:transmembrane protein 6/97 [Jackrogersella minutella]